MRGRRSIPHAVATVGAGMVTFASVAGAVPQTWEVCCWMVGLAWWIWAAWRWERLYRRERAGHDRIPPMLEAAYKDHVLALRRLLEQFQPKTDSEAEARAALEATNTVLFIGVLMDIHQGAP